MNSPSINPVKSKYKVRNWKEYNSNLCKRGSLTLFIDPAVLKEWESLTNKKKEVGEPTCPESIIRCCLLVKQNYRLPYRQSIGFLTGLLQMMRKEELPVPGYTTLCRRQGILPVEISNRLDKGGNLVVGIDSTGLKVYGEGEWKVRKHGWSKHRTWRKLHVCVDLVTREILSAELTGNNEDDDSVGAHMLKGQSHRLKSFKGDGACDKFGFREVLAKGVRQVIPLPKNGVATLPKKKKPVPEHLKQRNQAIEYIQKEGLNAWKEKEKYHQRSLNEVVMFKYKTIFGGELKARKMENQITEVKLKCILLNKFTGMGLPNSYKIV
jgi:hypothetical protein